MYLTTQQAPRFLQAYKASGHPQRYPFVLVALETSTRVSEVLSIRKEKINLVQQTTTYIPQAKAGTREQSITDNAWNSGSGISWSPFLRRPIGYCDRCCVGQGIR